MYRPRAVIDSVGVSEVEQAWSVALGRVVLILATLCGLSTDT